MIKELDFYYVACRNPPVRLHRVQCSCMHRLDQAIEDILGRLPREDPSADALRYGLRRLRWEALAEIRSPRLWYDEYASILDQLGQRAGLLCIPADAVADLCDAAESFASLGESPLLAALRSLMTTTDWLPRSEQHPARIVPYGSTPGVTKRRVKRLQQTIEFEGLTECASVSLAELRESRQTAQTAVFLASPGAFGQSVITCPVAHQSCFVFYGFLKSGEESSDWEHAYRDLAPCEAALPSPHWVVFSRSEQEHDCPMRSPATEHGARYDFEVYATPSWRELAHRVRTNEAADVQCEECVIVQLTGGLWAGISGRARRLERMGECWVTKSVEPDELSVGDLILLLVTDPTDHAIQTETALQQTHASGLELWRTVQQLGRSQVRSLGWSAVRDELRLAGIEAPYEYWFEEGRLGPDSEKTFHRLCSAMGLCGDECDEAWKAVRAWCSHRIRYGHQLVDEFVRQATRSMTNEPPPSDAPLIIELSDPAAGTYALVYVEGVAAYDRLPQTRIRRVLTHEGRPWSGPSRGGLKQRQ